MCGRVKLSTDWSEIRVQLRLSDLEAIANLQPSWNTAPTQDMLCITRDPHNGQRVSKKMLWGLIPANSQTGKMEFTIFNARSETIDTSRIFGPVWRAGKRCLVVADGFYEWCKGDKQPFAIARTTGKLTVMAGLWEKWQSKTTSERTVSCTVITTDSNDLIAPLHDRMPVILDEADWPAWLGEISATNDELLALRLG